MHKTARSETQNAAWERVQTVFHEALEQPVEGQWCFVEKACKDDPSVLREVLSMLEADAVGSRFLDAGAAGMAERMLSHAFSTKDFKSYKLIRLPGESGMGVVWLARREETDAPVAIKFLPHAGLSPARRDRFALEIKLLAKLRHPYIARLYDAGTPDDGTPWFVMEYVEGLPLNDYCEDLALSLEARLQLLHQVCEAVQYAHGRAIVHRDLKANILVEKDGTPRLLDFGIARGSYRGSKRIPMEMVQRRHG